MPEVLRSFNACRNYDTVDINSDVSRNLKLLRRNGKMINFDVFCWPESIIKQGYKLIYSEDGLIGNWIEYNKIIQPSGPYVAENRTPHTSAGDISWVNLP